MNERLNCYLDQEHISVRLTFARGLHERDVAEKAELI